MTKQTKRRLEFRFPVRLTGMKLGRGRARLAAAGGGGLVLWSATVALAISVLLAPGASLTVPATTAAAEPDLDGIVIHDVLVPFTLKALDGAALCTGKLQDRVVRSSKTGRLDFYYAIRETEGPGAVARIVTLPFGGLPLRVAYRTDGLGTVAPRVAARSVAPGVRVTLEFTDPPLLCARHEESRFMVIKTETTDFRSGGETQIFATTGAEFTMPTVMP
jgi:hypothetical protein